MLQVYKISVRIAQAWRMTDDSSSAPLLQRNGSALTNMSTDHTHNIQGQHTQRNARLRMPHHWAVVKTAAEDSMLLLRLAHVLVHIPDEGVIRVRLFAPCAHNIARLGECEGKESCLVVSATWFEVCAEGPDEDADLLTTGPPHRDNAR